MLLTMPGRTSRLLRCFEVSITLTRRVKIKESTACSILIFGSHLSLILDPSVRNRASEIVLLLSDVDKIRTERRKARANRNKYQGVGNDGGMSFVTSTGSRYGGFGSDSVGSGSSVGRYGGGDDFRSSSRGFRDSSAQQSQFDEYEGADDFDEQPPRRTTSISRSTAQAPPKPVAKEKEVEKPKEINLFDFDDEPVATPAAAPAATANAVPAIGGDGEFQSSMPHYL